MRTRAEAALALFFFALAACGKSTQGTAPTESAPSATATATTPPAMTENPTTQTEAGLPVGLFGGEPRPADAGEPRSAVLEKAREAALEGRSAEVRKLLETKVRGGHASIDEARLVRASCKNMGDVACKEDIEKKYPSLAR